jgi:hypothetical protein
MASVVLRCGRWPENFHPHRQHHARSSTRPACHTTKSQVTAPPSRLCRNPGGSQTPGDSEQPPPVGGGVRGEQGYCTGNDRCDAKRFEKPAREPPGIAAEHPIVTHYLGPRRSYCRVRPSTRRGASRGARGRTSNTSSPTCTRRRTRSTAGASISSTPASARSAGRRAFTAGRRRSPTCCARVVDCSSASHLVLLSALAMAVGAER